MITKIPGNFNLQVEPRVIRVYSSIGSHTSAYYTLLMDNRGRFSIRRYSHPNTLLRLY